MGHLAPEHTSQRPDAPQHGASCSEATTVRYDVGVVAIVKNVQVRPRTAWSVATSLGALTLFVAIASITVGLSGALAQTNAEVAEVVDSTGRFVEFDVDADLEAAIQRANEANIGFIWLGQSGGDAELVATGVRGALGEMNSRYITVVVLNNDGVWVDSRDGASATAAANESFSSFLAGDVAGGLDTVTSVMSGGTPSQDSTATTAGSATANDANNTGSTATGDRTSESGGSFPWLFLAILAVLGFLAFRFFNGRRRASKGAALDMERDRVEIREQLRDNADRVIELGDRAIAHGDAELIRMYEEASEAYQHVSLSIDGAKTAEEVDKLDEAIDEAEWKFEVIEARIEGRPEPTSPADLDPPPPTGPSAPQPGGQAPAPSGGTVTRRGRTIPPLGSPRDRPALGRDENILTERQRAPQTRRRSGGGGIGRMLTGSAGRMIMSVLASLLLGGLGNRGGSQRTRRRRSSGYGGSLGGGVLRNR